MVFGLSLQNDIPITQINLRLDFPFRATNIQFPLQLCSKALEKEIKWSYIVNCSNVIGHGCRYNLCLDFGSSVMGGLANWKKLSLIVPCSCGFWRIRLLNWFITSKMRKEEEERNVPKTKTCNFLLPFFWLSSCWKKTEKLIFANLKFVMPLLQPGANVVLSKFRQLWYHWFNIKVCILERW